MTQKFNPFFLVKELVTEIQGTMTEEELEREDKIVEQEIYQITHLEDFNSMGNNINDISERHRERSGRCY